MRLAQPRFSVRWMMVGVAVVAFVLGAWRWWELRSEFLERARANEFLEDTDSKTALALDGCAVPGWCEVAFSPSDSWGLETNLPDGNHLSLHRFRGKQTVWLNHKETEPCDAATVARLARDCRRAAAYHAALTPKYRRAALLPFLPVDPDPPKPEPERPTRLCLTDPQVFLAVASVHLTWGLLRQFDQGLPPRFVFWTLPIRMARLRPGMDEGQARAALGLGTPWWLGGIGGQFEGMDMDVTSAFRMYGLRPRPATPLVSGQPMTGIALNHIQLRFSLSGPSRPGELPTWSLISASCVVDGNTIAVMP